MEQQNKSKTEYVVEEMPPILLPWLNRWIHVRSEITPKQRLGVCHSLISAELGINGLDQEKIMEFTDEFYHLLGKYLIKAAEIGETNGRGE